MIYVQWGHFWRYDYWTLIIMAIVSVLSMQLLKMKLFKDKKETNIVMVARSAYIGLAVTIYFFFVTQFIYIVNAEIRNSSLTHVVIVLCIIFVDYLLFRNSKEGMKNVIIDFLQIILIILAVYLIGYIKLCVYPNPHPIMGI